MADKEVLGRVTKQRNLVREKRTKIYLAVAMGHAY